VLTDFDGTLAAIVPEPRDARPLPGVVEALSLLAERFGVVGVVSGRPVSFLAEQLAELNRAVVLVGLYGFERIHDGEIHVSAAADAWRGAVDTVVDAARKKAPRGIGVEAKGVSVTLHWRQAPQYQDWALAFADHWAQESGLALQPGRLAIELRPPVPGDKGLVVEELAAGCTAACFLGDDSGDLAAFAALGRLEASGTTPVRIAVSSPESPEELLGSADLVVQGPHEALSVLQYLFSLQP
jgi:trehalose 6-phosphate phosphatase